MKNNMGNADRLIRILAAVIMIVLFFTNMVAGPLSFILLAVGCVFLLTSLVGVCPLYSLFGINTCTVKKK